MCSPAPGASNRVVVGQKREFSDSKAATPRRDSSFLEGKASAGGSKGSWKWGQDGVPRTPTAWSSSGAGARLGGELTDAGWRSKRPGISVTPSGSRSGVRMEKKAETSMAPLTTGWLRRKSTPPPLSISSSLLEGSSPKLNSEPCPAPLIRAARGFHKLGSGGSGSITNIVEDVCFQDSPCPLTIECPTTSSSRGNSKGGSSRDIGAAVRTPSNMNTDRELAPTPPGGATDLTRKSRKLAMMMLATKEVEKFGAGKPASCQDLLAIANAAAMSEKPSPQPFRGSTGKLMRLLSQDATIDTRGGITPGRRKLVRMSSMEAATPVDEQGEDSCGVPSFRGSKMLSLRRTDSLSAAEYARRKSGPVAFGGAAQDGVGIPPRHDRDASNSGEALSSLDGSEQAPASTLATLGSRTTAQQGLGEEGRSNGDGCTGDEGTCAAALADKLPAFLAHAVACAGSLRALAACQTVSRAWRRSLGGDRGEALFGVIVRESGVSDDLRPAVWRQLVLRQTVGGKSGECNLSSGGRVWV